LVRGDIGFANKRGDIGLGNLRGDREIPGKFYEGTGKFPGNLRGDILLIPFLGKFTRGLGNSREIYETGKIPILARIWCGAE